MGFFYSLAGLRAETLYRCPEQVGMPGLCTRPALLGMNIFTSEVRPFGFLFRRPFAANCPEHWNLSASARQQSRKALYLNKQEPNMSDTKDSYAAESADNSWIEKGQDCPICAKHRDPKTGEPLFNAETIAGMQEVEDIISGKIPAKWYNSLDEMLDDLNK